MVKVFCGSTSCRASCKCFVIAFLGNPVILHDWLLSILCVDQINNSNTQLLSLPHKGDDVTTLIKQILNSVIKRTYENANLVFFEKTNLLPTPQRKDEVSCLSLFLYLWMQVHRPYDKDLLHQCHRTYFVTLITFFNTLFIYISYWLFSVFELFPFVVLLTRSCLAQFNIYYSYMFVSNV